MFFSKNISSSIVESELALDCPLIPVGYDTADLRIMLERPELQWLNAGFGADDFLDGYKSRFSIDVADFLKIYEEKKNDTALIACVYGDSWQRNDFFSRALTNSYDSVNVMRPLGLNKDLRIISEKAGFDLKKITSAIINAYLSHSNMPFSAINVNISGSYLLDSIRFYWPLTPVFLLVCEPGLMLSNWLCSDLELRYKMVDRFCRESKILSYEQRQSITPINAFFDLLEGYYDKVIHMSKTVERCYVFDNTSPSADMFAVLSDLMGVVPVDIGRARGCIVSNESQLKDIENKVNDNASLVPARIAEKFREIQRLNCYLGTGLGK